MPTPQQTVNALSLKQLGYLIALSDTLNFTRAAERCFVTQSTLSGGIAELERLLDAHLVERTRQQVMLTPLGAEVVARARSLVSAAADLVQAAQAGADPLGGTVVLGAIPTIAPFMLPRLLRGLRQRCPHLRVLLREDQTAVLLRAVEEGEIDFALLALPMDVGRLSVTPLFTEELQLVTSPADAHAVPDGGLRRLAQVDLHQLMLLSDGHCLREHTLAACQTGRRGRPVAPSSIEASSLPTLVQMVEAGLGVALLPRMAIDAGFLRGLKVVAQPLAKPAPQREIALVSRASSSRQAVIEVLRSLLAPAPSASA